MAVDRRRKVVFGIDLSEAWVGAIERDDLARGRVPQVLGTISIGQPEIEVASIRAIGGPTEGGIGERLVFEASDDLILGQDVSLTVVGHRDVRGVEQRVDDHQDDHQQRRRDPAQGQ